MRIFNDNKITNSTIISGDNKAIVNNVEIDIPEGASVSIKNNKVYINGKEYKDEKLENKEPINIIVNGNAENISCGNSVEVKGNVTGDIDCGNSVKIGGDMLGDIDCGNSVNISGNHTGDIDAGGSVRIK